MGVTGIGGLFFRARDPEALAAWYVTHLGVGAGCGGAADEEPDPWTWRTAAGPTVFAPFAATSDYFAADKPFMLNFRVTGLDDLLAGLRAAGIDVETRPEWDSPEAGRFRPNPRPRGHADRTVGAGVTRR